MQCHLWLSLAWWWDGTTSQTSQSKHPNILKAGRLSSLGNLDFFFSFLFFLYLCCILFSFDWFLQKRPASKQQPGGRGCCDNCWHALFLPLWEAPPFQTINVNLFVKTPAFCPQNQPWRQDTFLLFLPNNYDAHNAHTVLHYTRVLVYFSINPVLILKLSRM